jgi:hypothetical protein
MRAVAEGRLATNFATLAIGRAEANSGVAGTAQQWKFIDEG